MKLLTEVVELQLVLLMRPSSVCPFAMCVFEDVNENAPSIHRMNCDHYALYPMNCTMEIHSIAQISVLMALRRIRMAGSVLMAMLILYIYDIPNYCERNQNKKIKIVSFNSKCPKSVSSVLKAYVLSIFFIG